MRAAADRLVYYTLIVQPGGGSLRSIAQLFRSAASLRAHNRSIPVKLFLCGELGPKERARLAALDVDVEDHGDFEHHVRRFCPPRIAEVVARLPFLHEVTSLDDLASGEASRILYLDVDTFLFGDVERLFDRYAALDLYAREEPLSKRSAIGHDPEAFDEPALEALFRREGARFVPPFNNGVMLMTRDFASALAAHLGDLFRDVFRFAVGLVDHAREGSRYADLRYLAEHRDRLLEPADEAASLPYPIGNRVIKDELALWLTVGRIEGAKVGFFSPRDVLQGDEFRREHLVTQTVAHYFSGNTALFHRWVARRAALPAAPGRPSTPVEQAFAELGAAIEDAWEREHHDEHVFPRITAALLRDHRIPERLAVDDVILWLLGARSLPRQDDLPALFGHPPITVHAETRFYIQVILWLEGSTAIHRHAFCGAFQVLAGSSLHARYRFAEARRINASLLVGDLRLEEADVLERGAVAGIENNLVHSLFHLETPSATIVVRTRRDQEALPQYDYLPPHVAYDRAGANPEAVRREQALGFLRRSGRKDWATTAADLIARSDLHAGFHHLLGAGRAKAAPADVATLLGALGRRHGPVAGAMAASIEEDARRAAVIDLRARTADPGCRFFLALLANLPDSDSILATMARRYPGEAPRERALAWLAELSGVDRIGADLADPLNHELIPALLDGCSAAETRERLGRVFSAETVEAQREAIEEHARRLRTTILAPLFRRRHPDD